MVNAEDIQIINEVIAVLQPIEAVSTEICGDHYITISMVIPMVNCLEKKLLSLQPETDTGKEFKRITVTEISKRFGDVEANALLGISTLLDPRFKRLHFQKPLLLAQWINRIKHLLAENTFTKSEHSEPEPVSPITTKNTSENVKDIDNIWTLHDQLVQQNIQQGEGAESSFVNELQQYLKQPIIPRTSDPLEFWKTHKCIYPKLTATALEHFSIVATSVPSERLFSRAGNILDPSRNKLSSKRFSHILFLNSLDISHWNL
ncbi:zinc finger BED domain-containing protein 4-like [Anthonomus grandis grandis]|nr:zinc finger BED domain-containing protein 4-like [Anthonomus grandis grandis]